MVGAKTKKGLAPAWISPCAYPCRHAYRGIFLLPAKQGGERLARPLAFDFPGLEKKKIWWVGDKKYDLGAAKRKEDIPRSVGKTPSCRPETIDAVENNK